MRALAPWIGPALLVLLGIDAPVGLGLLAEPTAPDPNDPKLITRGKVVYEEQCARCHGANLEGQPNWRHRLANDRMRHRRTTKPDTHGITRTSNCSIWSEMEPPR